MASLAAAPTTDASGPEDPLFSDLGPGPGPLPPPSAPPPEPPPIDTAAASPITPPEAMSPSGPPPAIKPGAAEKQELHVTVPGEGKKKFAPPPARPVAQHQARAEQAIKFSCACGQVLHSRRLPGTQVMCPACGQILEVPGGTQEQLAAAERDAYRPRAVVHFQCECGDMLRSEEGIGSSVMCLNCGREAVTPADGTTMTQFQCECGEIIESEEPTGSETTCPSCNKSVSVPAVEEG